MRAVVTRVFALFFCLVIYLGLASFSFAEESPLAPAYVYPDITSAVSSGFVFHKDRGIYGPASVPQDHPIDKIASWMAKLEWDRVDPFYGSALPLLATSDRLFFVHNYHELPKARDKWAHLRASGKWSKFQPKAAYVAGYHKGFDLAVSWVSAKFLPEEVEELNRKFRAMYYTGELERGLWRVGVLGIPGPWRDPRQVFKNLLWVSEADMLSVWEDFNEEATISELFGPSRSKIPIELRSDCPPVFLTGCYRVPMRTWGYSGGAFIVAENRRDQNGELFMAPKIVGIPSHFVPLTESTYIIPARTVLKWGFEIANEFNTKVQVGEPFPLIIKNEDPSGTFRIEDEHTILALVGPMAGQRIYSTQSPFAPAGGESSGGGGESSGGGGESSGGGGESSGGGGESSGGGGESSGGGGESSGGGGESSGGGGESSGGGGPIVVGKDFYFVSDTLGNVAGLVDYKTLIEEVEHPERWQKRTTLINGLLGLFRGTKGVEAIIKYRHGVFTEDKRRIFRINNNPIVNLHDFFQHYSSNLTDASFRNDFINRPMPDVLELHRSDTPGIFGDLYLFKFKPSDQLDPRVFHPNVAQFNQINAPELAALLLHNMWEGKIMGKTVDAISIREWLSPGGAVSAASFEMAGGKLKVTAVIPRFGKFVMDFPDGFTPKGTSFYQYVGSIDVTNSGHTASMRYHGIANLEWDAQSNRWEFKIVMGGRVPHASLQTQDPNSPDGKLFSNFDGLAFQVFSLPLRVPANERLSELEVKPWELEQIEIGFNKSQELKRKRQAGFDVAWKEAEGATRLMVTAFPKVSVNTALNRSVNEYLSAFDQKFDLKLPGPYAAESDAVCRLADRNLRMREAERRMGLDIDTIFQGTSMRTVPRQLAFRVQMLENQQSMQQFLVSEPLTVDDIGATAQRALQSTSEMLGKSGAGGTLVDEVNQLSESMLKAFSAGMNGSGMNGAGPGAKPKGEEPSPK